jgi:hypothetical protein
MSIYEFHFKDAVSGFHIAVRHNDQEPVDAPELDHVIAAFVNFLKGVSFSSGTIAKYVDHEMV